MRAKFSKIMGGDFVKAERLTFKGKFTFFDKIRIRRFLPDSMLSRKQISTPEMFERFPWQAEGFRLARMRWTMLMRRAKTGYVCMYTSINIVSRPVSFWKFKKSMTLAALRYVRIAKSTTKHMVLDTFFKHTYMIKRKTADDVFWVDVWAFCTIKHEDFKHTYMLKCLRKHEILRNLSMYVCFKTLCFVRKIAQTYTLKT